MQVCSITILPLHGGKPFDLVFYGLDASRLLSVGNGEGGDLVKAALRRRGLHHSNFMSSPFYVVRMKSLITEGFPDDSPPDPPAIRRRPPKIVTPTLRKRKRTR